VQIAGPLVSMVDRPKLELDDPPIIKVNTIDEAKTLVARELARHPDFVKVWFIRMPERKLEDDEAIVRAVAEQTHAAKLRLLVHATELDTAKAALRAGADILVHSVFDKPVDDEFIALAKQRNIIFIPTLWVMPGYRAVLGSKFEPTDEERRLGDPQILDALAHAPPPPKPPMPIEPAPAAMDSLPRLWAAGIVIALGTDAGNIGTLHGPSVFREARLMQKAGLTVPQVLRAATVNGAKVLGLGRELGDVAAGRRADLVLVDADPLVSIDAWSHATFVIRAGRVFSPAELMASAR
jgi:imidazolonepropionase-like amidohydrolase